MSPTVVRRVTRLSMLAVVVALMAGCGGTTAKSTSATSPLTALPATTAPDSVPTSDGSTTTGAGRTPVPTSVKQSAADVDIVSSLVPEATASNDFAQTSLNGVLYSNALVISAESTPRKVEINAGRNHNKFRGVLGVPDDGKSSASFQVDISLDGGSPVFSAVIKFGETKDIDVDIPNVLRVRITVVSKDSSYGEKVAIGNPRFA